MIFLFFGHRREMPEYLVFLDGRYVPMGDMELRSLIDAYRIRAKISEVGKAERRIVSSMPMDAIFLRAAMIVRAERILGGDPLSVDWGEAFASSSTLGYNISMTYMVEGREKRIVDLIHRSIKRALPDAAVSVSAPQIIIRVRRTYEGDIICLVLPTGRNSILSRQPKYRPYAPSAAMDSIISRLLINLSQVLPGDIFLDPFCGTGSLLFEASAVGAKAIGLDINPNLVRAASMLLEYYGLRADVRIGDARMLPFEEHSIDAIATDPPYGISSPTYGIPISRLYEDFLGEAYRVLRSKARLVMCHTPSIHVSRMAEAYGFNVIAELRMKIHSKLTRIISVLRS